MHIHNDRRQTFTLFHISIHFILEFLYSFSFFSCVQIVLNMSYIHLEYVFVEGEKTQMKYKQTESELFDFCLNWHGRLPSPSFPCIHANGRIYAKVSQNSKLNDKNQLCVKICAMCTKPSVRFCWSLIIRMFVAWNAHQLWLNRPKFHSNYSSTSQWKIVFCFYCTTTNQMAEFM